MARKTSRKRRRERRAGPRPVAPPGAGSSEPPSPNGGDAAATGTGRGYARSRAKNEAARAALKPLRPGERPAVVTIGAAVAGVLALANLVALVVGWDTGPGSEDGNGQAVAGSLLVTAVLTIVAAGMWRARYWAVLGMQTLLAITIVFASLGLITATSAWAAVLLVLIIAGAGTLFWFMVKAMARIQMPERPGARPRGR